MAPWLTIGQLAQTTGVPAKTIRYYEQVGVLPLPRRTDAGYRQYAQRDTHRLLFIRRARALGLSLKRIQTLSAALDSGSSGSIRPQLLDLVRTQLHTVQQQVAEFKLLEQQLTQVLQRLQTAAPAPEGGRCECLDIDKPPVQGQPLVSANSASKGEAMSTSALESLTMLTPSTLSETNGSDHTNCDCGCGCGVPLIQLSRPLDKITGSRGKDEQDNPV